MRQRWRRTAGLTLLLAAAATARANDAPGPVREGPVVVAAKASNVGERVDDLAFVDVDGKPGKLSDLRASKAVVICLTSASCPVARKYAPTIAELAKRFAPRGVAFVAVNVSAADSPDKARAAAADLKAAGWTGRYVADAQGAIAAALSGSTTTEVFVLDRARTLAYRGAIDDQYGLGYTLPEPRQHFLTSALEAVLADQQPATRATTAPGCALAVAAKPAAAAPAKLTYHSRVSRIVQAHCVECHRKGENGPFELTSFADVKGNATMIKKVVGKRTMPPWFADAKNQHAFKNDRSLSDRDRNDLASWVDAGCVEGEASDAPVAIQFAQGWRIGKPDLILESPKTETVPARGTIPYRYVMVPTNLTEDKWVSAMEVRPSATEVVHHLLVFVSLPPGDPRAKQFRSFAGGLNGYFAGMVPGQGDITFPQGTAKLLPKGATLIFQIHYTANGKETQDRPRIGLRFADKKPEFEAETRAACNRSFQIPPNDPNFRVEASHTFFQPTRLLSINPHSHVRGKAFKFELFYPDRDAPDVILDLPRYDFNWQIEHQFAKPIDVPAGTRLKVTGWYDNSKENPANPDPSKWVKFGEQTWNEMMVGYFTGYVLK